MEQLRFINAKIYFILQLGYFKARNMFFVFDPQEVGEDIRFIRSRYFPDFQDLDPDIAKVTRLKQQRTILKLGNYRSWNAKERAMLEALTSIKRAGADIIITYFAKDAVRLLAGGGV